MDFCSPVFLPFCPRTTVEGGFGRHYRRTGLKEVAIRVEEDVCPTRVWTGSEGPLRTKGGLEPRMGSCALWGIGWTFKAFSGSKYRQKIRDFTTKATADPTTRACAG